MDKTRKYHLEYCADPKGHAQYVLTNKWILEKKKYKIPKIRSTELIKVNKLKGPSEGTSVPLGWEKKGTSNEYEANSNSVRKAIACMNAKHLVSITEFRKLYSKKSKNRMNNNKHNE